MAPLMLFDSPVMNLKVDGLAMQEGMGPKMRFMSYIVIYAQLLLIRLTPQNCTHSILNFFYILNQRDYAQILKTTV